MWMTPWLVCLAVCLGMENLKTKNEINLANRKAAEFLGWWHADFNLERISAPRYGRWLYHDAPPIFMSWEWAGKHLSGSWRWGSGIQWLLAVLGLTVKLVGIY
jgi:hypothetical protein